MADLAICWNLLAASAVDTMQPKLHVWPQCHGSWMASANRSKGSHSNLSGQVARRPFWKPLFYPPASRDFVLVFYILQRLEFDLQGTSQLIRQLHRPSPPSCGHVAEATLLCQSIFQHLHKTLATTVLFRAGDSHREWLAFHCFFGMVEGCVSVCSVCSTQLSRSCFPFGDCVKCWRNIIETILAGLSFWTFQAGNEKE